MALFDFLDKEHSIAQPGFNRWLVPPAALAIHLCIGMAYGFSVFWLPLSKAIGITNPVVCAPEMSFIVQIFSSTCDWQISTLGWMYTLFFVLLGSSAAIFGGWLEHAGPRKAGAVAALCWAGGLVISALGVYTHQIVLMWLGSGVIGGIGLGLGYISPVSTLIKWFPDRRGMATGMAIMGFGGGAMIGAPMANELMKHFATATSVGVWETFLVMAAAIGLETGRLDATRGQDRQPDDHRQACACEQSVGNSAVLANLGCVVLERDSRYRRAGHGVTAAAGSLCRQIDRY
jgi:MFS family permease